LIEANSVAGIVSPPPPTYARQGVAKNGQSLQEKDDYDRFFTNDRFDSI
jgi:hypothetical protein